MKLKDFLICMNIVNIILLISASYNIEVGFNMYKDFDTYRGDALGMYIRDSYYCVSTVGLNESYIYYVEVEEMCHSLVRDDKKHFCKGKE